MFPCCCAQPESEHFLLSTMAGMKVDSLYIEDNDGSVLLNTGEQLYSVQITPIGLFALRSRYPGVWVARDQFYNTTGECAVRFRLAKDTDPYTSTDVLASRTECDFPGYAPRAPYGNVASSCRDLCPPVYVASWLGQGFQVRRWWHPALDCLVQWSVTTNYFGSPFGTTFGHYEYFPYECTDEEESHTIRGVFLNWPATWPYGDPGYADCLAQYKLKYPVTLTPESEGGAYSNWYGITVEHRSYVEPVNMQEGCLPSPFNQSLAVLADHPDRHLNHLAITDEGLRAMALMLTSPAIDQWQLALYSNDVTPSSHSVIDDFTLYPASTGIGLIPPGQSHYPELDDTWVHDEDGERKGSIYKQGFHYLQGTQELLDIGSSPSYSLPVTANVYGWVMMARVSPSNTNVLIAAGRFPGAPYALTHAQYDPFIVRLRLRFDVWEHFSDEATSRNCPYGTTSGGLMVPEDMDADADPHETKECYAVWTDPTAEDALVIRLHTGDPGVGGGANQYSGGSYSEMYPSWDSASGGYRAMTSPLVFEGVASEAVTWASLWGYDFDLFEYVWLGNAELQGDTAFGLDDKLTMLAGSTKYAVP